MIKEIKNISEYNWIEEGLEKWPENPTKDGFRIWHAIPKGSPTFGKSFSKVLSAKNKRQLFIPKGFAHGFSVLSEKAEVLYKCDGFYNKESEGGIIYNDPALEIDWRIPAEEAIISDKDKVLPTLAECRNSFVF